MIRCCDDRDVELIWTIINDGARAYKGVIPADCWTEPYMSRNELRQEMEHGVTFWGYEESEALEGVMGVQHVQDFNGSIAGPIVKDRLWWFTSARQISVNEKVTKSPSKWNQSSFYP